MKLEPQPQESASQTHHNRARLKSHRYRIATIALERRLLTATYSRRALTRDRLCDATIRASFAFQGDCDECPCHRRRTAKEHSSRELCLTSDADLNVNTGLFPNISSRTDSDSTRKKVGNGLFILFCCMRGLRDTVAMSMRCHCDTGAAILSR